MHVFLSVELNVAVDRVDYIVELSKIESKRNSMNGKCGFVYKYCIVRSL